MDSLVMCFLYVFCIFWDCGVVGWVMSGEGWAFGEWFFVVGGVCVIVSSVGIGFGRWRRG